MTSTYIKNLKLFSSIAAAAVIGNSLVVPNSIKAVEVDPKIHKLCIEAKDYAGCVRAMNGDTMPSSRVINSQGADIAEGNQCPSGWAYVGGGNCQQVKCEYDKVNGLGFSEGHDQRVAGKANWKCKGSFWYGAGVMRVEGNSRATINPECPLG